MRTRSGLVVALWATLALVPGNRTSADTTPRAETTAVMIMPADGMVYPQGAGHTWSAHLVQEFTAYSQTIDYGFSDEVAYNIYSLNEDIVILWTDAWDDSANVGPDWDMVVTSDPAHGITFGVCGDWWMFAKAMAYCVPAGASHEPGVTAVNGHTIYVVAPIPVEPPPPGQGS